MPKMVVSLGPCHSRRQNLFASTTHGDTFVCLHPLLFPSPPCSVLQDHIYFITASNTEGFVPFANLDVTISRADVISVLFGVVRSNPPRVSQNRCWLSKFLLCVLHLGKNDFPKLRQQSSPLTFAFASAARGIVVVGTADGSLHLINPNSWRRHIRRIQPHRLYIAMLQDFVCVVSLLTSDPQRVLLLRVARFVQRRWTAQLQSYQSTMSCGFQRVSFLLLLRHVYVFLNADLQ